MLAYSFLKTWLPHSLCGSCSVAETHCHLNFPSGFAYIYIRGKTCKQYLKYRNAVFACIFYKFQCLFISPNKDGHLDFELWDYFMLFLLLFSWGQTINLLLIFFEIFKRAKWRMETRFNLRKTNWWKGKPSGSIACTRKQQPRFYWSCSSVVMNDATPLTPTSAWAELHFQM